MFYLYQSVLCFHVSLHTMCLSCIFGVCRRASDLLESVTGNCKLSCASWELNQQPAEDQQTSAPYLWPICAHCWVHFMVHRKDWTANRRLYLKCLLKGGIKKQWKLIFSKHRILEHWGKKVLDTKYLELFYRRHLWPVEVK